VLKWGGRWPRPLLVQHGDSARQRKSPLRQAVRWSSLTVTLWTMKRYAAKGIKSDYVFVNERGEPFGRMGIGRKIERAGEAAGLSFSVHVHMLRRSTGYALAAIHAAPRRWRICEETPAPAAAHSVHRSLQTKWLRIANRGCQVSASPRGPVHERQAARIAHLEACPLNYVHQSPGRP
jgi:hypothetical protein